MLAVCKRLSDSDVPRQSTSSLVETAFLDEVTGDIHFVFKLDDGETDRIPAHKLLLKLKSGVFDAMFYGSLKVEQDVQIVDASPDAFKEFLSSFYFDEPKLTMAHISEVLNLARKYDVDNCRGACVKLLEKSLALDNVCCIYEIGLEFDFHHLQRLCECKISIHGDRIFQSIDFMDASYGTVLRIITLDWLNCDEYAVFVACFFWAKNMCRQEGVDSDNPTNLRSQLRHLVQQIRFRSMNSKQIGEVFIAGRKLFTDDEMSEIVLLGLSHSEAKILSNKFRSRVWYPLQALQCMMVAKDSMHPANRYESITFSSTEEVLLGNISISRIYSYTSEPESKYRTVTEYVEENLNLEIIEKSETENVVRYKSESKSVKFGRWFKLPKTIWIRPKVKYELRLEYWDESGKTYYCRPLEKSQFKFADNSPKIRIDGDGSLISGLTFCTFRL